MRIAFIGAGTHLHSVYDSLDKNKFEVVGCLDNLLKDETKEGIKILGGLREFDKLTSLNIEGVFICLGDLEFRRSIIEDLNKLGLSLITIIDESAVISRTAIIEEGTFIGKNVVVNAYAHVGSNCILNTACVVEHDCFLESNVHIAPGAILCGGVKVGQDTMIGANATIIQTIQIGRGVIIGAGSTIIRNVLDNKKVAGTPGREI